MGAALSISANWLGGIKNAMGNVVSSGQAYAALDAALDAASDVSAAIREGGGWFSSDPWRDGAAADVDNAATQVRKERGAYSADSDIPIDGAAWAGAAQKAIYLYSLAEVARQGYPAGEDSGGIESVMLAAATNLTGAILAAPSAVVKYTSTVASDFVGAAQKVGVKAVKAAGTIIKTAAEEAKGAAENLIPWTPIIAAVAIVAGAVFLVVYASKAGVLKDVAKLKPV
jgi:hypothetical protein